MNFKRTALLSVISVVALAAVGCSGNRKTSSENPEDFFVEPTEGERAFSSITEFDEPIDFHTDAQKAYIAYKETGNYEDLTSSQITTNYGCNGQKNLSAPNPIKIAFEQDPGEGFDKYVVEVSTDYKFENDVHTFEASESKKEVEVYNTMIDTTYYYRVKAIYGEEIAYSKTTTFQTGDINIRNLYVDGMTNCRDMGGKHTADGGRFKQGLIYRTAALDDSQSGSIATAKGLEQIREWIAPVTEIELRGAANGAGGEAKSEKKSAKLDEVNFQFMPFAYSGGKNLLFRNIESVRKTFNVLGNPDNYPIFFHCRIGTDRTGLIALLINALCGVELQDIYQDYLFSDFGCIGKVPTIGQANEDSIAEYVKELCEFPGEKLQNSVYNFLLTAGIPAETLDNIINLLTTEGAVKGNDSSKVYCETVDNMEVEGATLTTNTKDFRMPAAYATYANSGDRVVYTFNSDKAFEADLYANLVSRKTSGKLNSVLAVWVNGEEITVNDISMATNTLGFDSSIDCWIPTKLGQVSLEAGENTIEIEYKGATVSGNNRLNISQIAFSGMSESAKID